MLQADASSAQLHHPVHFCARSPLFGRYCGAGTDRSLSLTHRSSQAVQFRCDAQHFPSVW
jgi:hypothetical protein